MTYTVRRATVADAATMGGQRRRMFEAMGSALTAAEAAELDAASARSLGRALATDAFHGWLVEHDGQPVACGMLQVRPRLAAPGLLEGGEEAYIFNMWTDPEHRRRGLAASILDAMLAWCAERGIRRITLHAAPDGRAIYERYGFEPTNEMRRPV